MKISVFGLGYVGSVTGICFAELGHNIIFFDIDERKMAQIENGNIPVFEPDLQEILIKNKKNISISYNPQEATIKTELSIICVGTPPDDQGAINLDYIKEASRSIGQGIARKDTFHTVLIKSTIIPGTTEDVIVPIIEKASKKKMNIDFTVLSNPEFLREGKAVHDFFHPDRIIIGSDNSNVVKIIENIYSRFDCPKMITSLKTAEMIKYVSNGFLATKISFANEIGNICKKIGIDSYEVFKGVGMDSRINPQFFRSGIGFGGSCFPKDIRALIAFSKEVGVEPRILNAVLQTNENQPDHIIHILKQHIDISGKIIGILGLAFKPDTDDIRESRAIPIILKLKAEGAHIIAYDPMAMENFRLIFPDIEYAKDSKKVLSADAILILTEWVEFAQIDYQGKIVIDGRKIERAKNSARIYEGVCW